MAIKFPELFAALEAPFAPHEVKSRPQGGRQLPYITARTAMNRLDNVVGPADWWDDYVPGQNSVMCRLTIRLPDGSTVTKCDAGGYAGMADQGDDDKSGFSDAFKRACAKFGVGRYLYSDGVPSFAKEEHGEVPNDPPAREQRGQWGGGQRQGGGGQRSYSGPPKSGKALFAWVKDQEQRHEVGLLKYLNNWAKLHEFPGRMVDWDESQVEQAHAEAVRKIQAVEPAREREPGEDDTR